MTPGPSDTGLGYLVKQERIAIDGGADLNIRSLLNKHQFHDPLGIALALGVSSATWPIAGLRILEIGCGLGLASLVIHRRLGNVTASDYHHYTDRFLRTNLLLNDMQTLPYVSGHWERANPLLGEFDLIIGSDVLYERDHPLQLAGFIQRHAAGHAQVLIIDPNRGNRAAFYKAMQINGFALTQTDLLTPLQDMTPYRSRFLSYQRD